MIHWLQTLWWEWKWNRLKSKREMSHRLMPLAWACDQEEYARLVRSAVRLQREMADLEERITGRAN